MSFKLNRHVGCKKQKVEQVNRGVKQHVDSNLNTENEGKQSYAFQNIETQDNNILARYILVLSENIDSQTLRSLKYAH